MLRRTVRTVRIVYRIPALLYAFSLFAVVMPASAENPSDARNDGDRWIPSLGLAVGFTTQLQEGSSLAQEPGGFGTFRPYDKRPFTEGDTSLNLLNVGGTFELQTPQLLRSKWSPRIFIGGEILNVSAQRQSLAREQDPQATLTYPNDNPQGSFPDVAILGQGSAIESDAENIQYGASIGLAIPIQLGDWRISIKPSAQYLNQEIFFRGIVSDANRTNKLIGFPPTRVILLQGSKSLDVHAVGPGLEIEVEAARVKSIVASVFIGGGAYRVLSDRKVSFTTTKRATGDPSDTRFFRATWDTEINPWIYRGSVGMRVKWMGLSPGWFGGALGRAE